MSPLETCCTVQVVSFNAQTHQCIIYYSSTGEEEEVNLLEVRGCSISNNSRGHRKGEGRKAGNKREGAEGKGG
jgi:hypothetical protein